MEAATPKINDSVIKEFMTTCKSEKDDSQRCRRIIGQLQAENKKLKKWVSDLQSGMYVNCVYCGHRYGPSDKVPASMADVLKQHIEQCPEHPMSKLKKENEKLLDTCLAAGFIGNGTQIIGEKRYEELLDAEAENAKLKDLIDTVLISCSPPKDCNDVAVLKTYMKACFDKATELKE